MLYFLEGKDFLMCAGLLAVCFLSLFITSQSYALETHYSKFRKLITKSIFETTDASGDKIGIGAISKNAENEVIVYINQYDSFETVICEKVEVFQLIKNSLKINGKRHISQLKVGLCSNKSTLSVKVMRY